MFVCFCVVHVLLQERLYVLLFLHIFLPSPFLSLSCYITLPHKQQPYAVSKVSHKHEQAPHRKPFPSLFQSQKALFFPTTRPLQHHKNHLPHTSITCTTKTTTICAYMLPTHCAHIITHIFHYALRRALLVAMLSLSVQVRFSTRHSGVESGSTQKYPKRSN